MGCDGRQQPDHGHPGFLHNGPGLGPAILETRQVVTQFHDRGNRRIECMTTADVITDLGDRVMQ